MTHMLRKLIRAGRRLTGSLHRDRRGVAAVEFGIIAPVLLVMLVGVVEVTRAVSIDRRFGQVTSMVADLVAREENMTAANLNAIYGIVEHIMGVWGTSGLKLQIIPVKANPTNKDIRLVYARTTNRPSYGGASQLAYCASYTKLDADMLAAGTSVIVVEAEYTYKPLLIDSIFPEQTWYDRATLAPRNSCVDFDDDNCVSTCF
ncbi:MAG: TadE/TadG family type IV pilus assembly protein [Hyphomicrobium sp.]|nr:TadE/TadG family type IV pilus assembly protein [Hyphomicrobium sp.]